MARDSLLPKQEMIKELQQRLPPDFSNPDQPHRILANLPLPVYLTTNYDDFMRDDMRVFGDACADCGVRELCGGVYPEYVEYYGWGELWPLDRSGERAVLQMAG